MNVDLLKDFRTTLANDAGNYGVQLSSETVDRLETYYELLSSWNPRLHLVAPTSPREFATRHILESLLLLKYFPDGATVADIGSGGGLPIVPCLIVRQDLQATLIESSKKKAVFLHEALRQPRQLRGSVVADRFENIVAPDVHFVTCRAVERFEKILPQLVEWAPPTATLLLFGGAGLQKSIEAIGFNFSVETIPNSERRFLYGIRRANF